MNPTNIDQTSVSLLDRGVANGCIEKKVTSKCKVLVFKIHTWTSSLGSVKCCWVWLSVASCSCLCKIRLSILSKVHISMCTRCCFLLKIFNVHTLFFLYINFTIAKFRSVFFDENYQRAHVGKFLWNLNYKLYYIAKFISMK